MIMYKLTNQELQTYNGFQWEIGKWYTTSGEGSLCSNGWFHFYDDPLLAILLNPIHADIENPRLFAVKVSGKKKTDKGLKYGYSKAKLIKEIDILKITITQHTAFGILCALEVYNEKSFINWAKNWLNDKDKSKESAIAAVYAADAAIAAVYAADAAVATANKLLNLKQIAKKAMKY